MTTCDDIRKEYCQSACCYFKDKPITSEEAVLLGDEGAIKVDGEWRLRNNPMTGACVYLDTQEGRCEIYTSERRPSVCKEYSCANDGGRIERIITRIGQHDIRTSSRVIDDLLQEARRNHPGLSNEEITTLLQEDEII